MVKSGTEGERESVLAAHSVTRNKINVQKKGKIVSLLFFIKTRKSHGFSFSFSLPQILAPFNTCRISYKMALLTRSSAAALFTVWAEEWVCVFYGVNMFITSVYTSVTPASRPHPSAKKEEREAEENTQEITTNGNNERTFVWDEREKRDREGERERKRKGNKTSGLCDMWGW